MEYTDWKDSVLACIQRGDLKGVKEKLKSFGLLKDSPTALTQLDKNTRDSLEHLHRIRIHRVLGTSFLVTPNDCRRREVILKNWLSVA